MEANQAAQQLLRLDRNDSAFASTAWEAIAEDGSPLTEQHYPHRVALASGRPVTNVMMGVTRPDGPPTGSW